MEEKKKKPIAVLLVILAVIAVFAGFFILFRMTFVSENVSRFSDAEIAEIGQEYNMDLSGAELKNYRRVKAPDSISECTFVMEDCRAFMERNFMGTVKNIEENGDSEVRCQCEPYPGEKTRIYITFIKKKDGWTAKLSHSRYV